MRGSEQATYSHTHKPCSHILHTVQDDDDDDGKKDTESCLPMIQDGEMWIKTSSPNGQAKSWNVEKISFAKKKQRRNGNSDIGQKKLH